MQGEILSLPSKHHKTYARDAEGRYPLLQARRKDYSALTSAGKAGGIRIGLLSNTDTSQSVNSAEEHLYLTEEGSTVRPSAITDTDTTGALYERQEISAVRVRYGDSQNHAQVRHNQSFGV